MLTEEGTSQVRSQWKQRSSSQDHATRDASHAAHPIPYRGCGERYQYQRQAPECSRSLPLYAGGMLTTTNPAILYFGTPVVLVSSLNPDGSANLAPMSSAWWLGWRCMLGFGARSATPQNILRTGECVLNLPSAAMAPYVDRLALTTASDPVPESKQKRGYRHEAQKFERAGLTAVPSEVVATRACWSAPSSWRHDSLDPTASPRIPGHPR